MSNTVQIKVPDIGDFKEVEVIEVLVAVGDTIKAEQSLITVESDKASMEIPASQGGVVKSIAVKVGDKVAEGAVVLEVEASDAAAAPAAKEAPAKDAPKAAEAPKKAEAAAAPAAKAAAPAASSFKGSADGEYDMLVLGAGPGGYSAAFRAADLGLSVVLVERYATLGGVCLNVGCIPSKALLHNAAVIDEARELAAHGISFGEPKIDLDKLRGYKDSVVAKLTGGLAGMARARKVTVVTGVGEFADPYHLTVTSADGKSQTLRFKQAIIAAGSQSVKLPFMPKDDRVVDSTGALLLREVPKKMLIVGGGIIGLEMGTVYSTLGARLDVVEMLDGLMQGADRDLVKVWQKKNAYRFDNIMLKTKTVGAEAKKDGIYVTFEGEGAPKEPQRYDLVLQAVGRSPNGKKIGADKAGIAVTDRGFIEVDRQMRTNVPHIYAIGDIVGQPMLAHKAVHEGHVAAEAAAGQKSFFDARVIPSVAYTDPEVAWVGLTEDEAKKQGIKIEKGVFPWAASGRAIANGRDEGFTKLIFDAETHRILGGSIVGTHAGDLISELALAVEMGADVVDIAKTIHPHPTLGESVGMAAEVAEGVCTDLPPMKKK
ncbi:Dihydrolipoyl dehydrogenase [Achromobacter spanius]|uniref:dihydrolipoyl dehydrogenase n=1 Tax=Achromobacter spanius TaxID=217203 RepID=UPI000C2C58A3|nr:dihydrolipoyl dehydrogenase [Achromobacter spanius]AUA57510.1 dihydrolipoyl dehydrogenase [Achromobacter spanius]CAB3628481.1 Soluble pyridine nucleotide transhydrogenase [Achromobacter spanius]SPT37443.1 Dihydrolipoyl dehydrogenase [Achromobacter denitrificans]VEE54766.1 Dihydrolipoyl dehydrogenase [Achromobacter spanius]